MHQPSRRRTGLGTPSSSVPAGSDHSSKHNNSRTVTMTRRSTSNAVQKSGKSQRDREREREEDRWWQEERESFPQYCMTCEKQFVPQDDRFLYCSEACRVRDQNNASATTATLALRAHAPGQTVATSYPVFSPNPEPKDIIPRASPSRPTSTYFSSPPATPNTVLPTSAISALRSLSIRPPSPPSPTSSVWPFTRSAATSPSTSYTNGRTAAAGAVYSSTYDATSYYAVYGNPSDRPLPSRVKPGSGYARPKSIELVTPMVGR